MEVLSALPAFASVITEWALAAGSCGVLTGVGHFEIPRGVPERHGAEGLVAVSILTVGTGGVVRNCFFRAGFAAAFQGSGGKPCVTSSECWACCRYHTWRFKGRVISYKRFRVPLRVL